ncbi:hypothetical protein AB4543_19745 [Vibrio splendidus]
MNYKSAHISIIYSPASMSGVIKKITAMAKSTPSIDFYIISPIERPRQNNLIFLTRDSSFKNKVLKYYGIDKIVDFVKYNKIIIRYVGADHSLLMLSEKYKDKLIIEHHTKEINELKNRKLNLLFKFFQIINEIVYPRFIFPYLFKVTAVTNDILNYQKSRYIKSQNTAIKKFLVLPNGLNKNDFLDSKDINIKRDDEFLEFVFVASNFSKWHGYDRLLKSLLCYTGSRKIKLNIVGLSEPLENNMVDSNVVILNHGMMDKQSLYDLLSSSDIAIDSLGLHRLGFSDSSTLKSRDYILNCLPIIASCHDSSLSSIRDYIYYAGNDETIIDFNSVIEWYAKLKLEELCNVYKNSVINTLDWGFVFKKIINDE